MSELKIKRLKIHTQTCQQENSMFISGQRKLQEERGANLPTLNPCNHTTELQTLLGKTNKVARRNRRLHNHS